MIKKNDTYKKVSFMLILIKKFFYIKSTRIIPPFRVEYELL